MDRSICKGCGKEIIWIRTRNWKMMPCDPEEVLIRIHPGGRRKFVLKNGDVVCGDTEIKGCQEIYTAYETHWASCKEAGRFKAGSQKKLNL